ncbi:E3 ubiquitin-protein ligase hrd1 [Aspergillus melleus]|uniref:E3 ubiquitin-protein ligase hrd1 n=1 Tax=Aspergillus melleus TaxID=138277 RepID=A0ACC3ANI6_9EURO|nr:E3 ubiquitin-protein ligase hrd1 [Aspergillus melleus]
MRLAAYAGASVALATGVFLKALHQRANFYSACVYLSQSSASLMILTNLSLLAVGFFLFWLQRLLYGPLRPIETEQLYEKGWFAITETCLAMTIFRGELGGWFLVMFVCLLVGKVWGWIGEGRVEYLEQQPPANPRLFHIRMAASLLISVLFNAFMLRYCITTVLEQARPDMMVMFGFEFAVLTILSSSTAARYSISLVEIYITHQQTKAKLEERRQEIRAVREEAIREHARRGETAPPADLPDENDVNEMELDVPGWEEKSRWIFYLDLVTDFLKLIVYLSFFAILFTFYGLPIHILRDVVATIRSFGRRIIDFVRFRNATRDMNERYPDATAEEVAREEVCIICREEMTHWQQPAPGQPLRARVSDRLRPKKLPCGHILHFACLRSWLERQQNCPTCRRPVIAPPRPRGDAGNVANNAQGGQQNFAGGNQAPGRNADGLPRARVYQFGPFRIGFGAGRGDLFHNLHRQIQQGNVPPQPANNANVPGPQQIGFGFGFGQPQQAAAQPPAPNPTITGVPDMRNQLQQMEQQIMQEIHDLRVTADQLSVVRQLQTELQRLRTLQSNPTEPLTNVFTNPSVPPTSTAPSSIFARHHYIADNPVPTLAADDSQLPEGLTLPQGWSLVPLQSTTHGPPGATSSSASLAVPATTSPAQTTDHASMPHAATVTHVENEDQNHGDTTASVSASQGLPDWGRDGAESPSQQWTDVASETQPEKGGMSSTHAEERENEDGQSTSSKGKARAATVEDAADDES